MVISKGHWLCTSWY